MIRKREGPRPDAESGAWLRSRGCLRVHACRMRVPVEGVGRSFAPSSRTRHPTRGGAGWTGEPAIHRAPTTPPRGADIPRHPRRGQKKTASGEAVRSLGRNAHAGLQHGDAIAVLHGVNPAVMVLFRAAPRRTQLRMPPPRRAPGRGDRSARTGPELAVGERGPVGPLHTHEASPGCPDAVGPPGVAPGPPAADVRERAAPGLPLAGRGPVQVGGTGGVLWAAWPCRAGSGSLRRQASATRQGSPEDLPGASSQDRQSRARASAAGSPAAGREAPAPGRPRRFAAS